MDEYMLVGLVCMLVAGLIFRKNPIGKVLLSVVAAVVVAIVTFIAMIIAGIGSIYGDVYMTIIGITGLAVFVATLGVIWKFIKKKYVFIPIIVVIITCIALVIGLGVYEDYIQSIPQLSESGGVIYDYSPFVEDSVVATLDEESTLKITEDFPVLDGATALYPVYAAFAKAVYPEEMFRNENGWMKYDNEYLYCSTTTHAYERIVTGEADIIFVASPNKNQMQVAKDCGVELVFTPIGKEAFVFFVNSKNPIEDISLEDVRKIYSGEITKWNELGVKGLGRIKAFQRDEGSGSQSTLEKLMAGKELMTPPKEDVVSGMGGIINKTADYKNFKNAIGYSFRFYSTQMVQNDMIKLLSINGVEPKLENIENGTYPIGGEFYAVTRSDADENTKKLLEWIQGEQGQKLIEKTGYTPIK